MPQTYPASIEFKDGLPLQLSVNVRQFMPRGAYGYLPLTVGNPAHSLGFIVIPKRPEDTDWYKPVSALTSNYFSIEESNARALKLLSTSVCPTSVIGMFEEREIIFGLDGETRRRLAKQNCTGVSSEATIEMMSPEPRPRYLILLPFTEIRNGS